jgi:hypothetical protein
MARKNKIWLAQPDFIRRLYQSNTITEIAELFGCTHPTVLNYMKKHGIERRDHDEKFIHGHNYSKEWYETQERAKKKGPEHPAYKGGTYIDADGYRRTYVGDGKYEREHRRIAESKIGRKLTGEEQVHHKDKNRLNNDPDNLEVLTAEEHYELHEPERDEKYG